MMQTTINNCFQRTATTWIKACLVVIGVIACSLQYTAVIGWCPLLVRQQGQHGLRHVRQVSSARRQAALATPTTSTQDDDIGSSAALAADVQMTSVVMNHTKTLINYATGISAARRRRSSSRWLQFDTDQNDSNHYKTRKKKQSQQYQAKQDQAMGACRSLLQFLNNKDISIDSQSMTEFNNTRTSVASPSQYYILPHIDEALARACVQALRAAGEANDYIYITNLIDTVVAYCCGYYNTAFLPSGNSNTTSPIIVLLHSRIFGEAITAMMITDAGPSKIKRIWQRLLEVSNYNHQYKNNNNTTTTNLKLQQQHQQQSHSNLSIINTNILASQPSAMEMNYMIRALSSRKKYHAALHLYYNHDFIIPDSFTVTSCLKMLIDSIIVSSSNIEKSTEESASSATSIAKTAMQVVIKKKKKVTTKEHEESSDEGFWQWEEAKKVIEYARTKQQQKNTQQQQQQQQQQNELLINSHVYGALLTLNEKLATRRRDMIHNHDVISKNTHDEAANALDILQQMQVRKETESFFLPRLTGDTTFVKYFYYFCNFFVIYICFLER